MGLLCAADSDPYRVRQHRRQCAVPLPDQEVHRQPGGDHGVDQHRGLCDPSGRPDHRLGERPYLDPIRAKDSLRRNGGLSQGNGFALHAVRPQSLGADRPSLALRDRRGPGRSHPGDHLGNRARQATGDQLGIQEVLHGPREPGLLLPPPGPVRRHVLSRPAFLPQGIQRGYSSFLARWNPSRRHGALRVHRDQGSLSSGAQAAFLRASAGGQCFLVFLQDDFQGRLRQGSVSALSAAFRQRHVRVQPRGLPAAPVYRAVGLQLTDFRQ